MVSLFYLTKISRAYISPRKVQGGILFSEEQNSGRFSIIKVIDILTINHVDILR